MFASLVNESPTFDFLAIVTFDVGQNELSSTLSSAIGNWKDLSKLFLQDNDLSGPLPESLKELNISE
jgi:Leucine-rich repeat (LRR) protein